jgi:hypothetical protein
VPTRTNWNFSINSRPRAAISGARCSNSAHVSGFDFSATLGSLTCSGRAVHLAHGVSAKLEKLRKRRVEIFDREEHLEV